MIWHPAAEERQDHDGDRFGDSGSPFGVAGVHALPSNEAQEHQIVHRDDEHWDYKGYQDFLDVVKC